MHASSMQSGRTAPLGASTSQVWGRPTPVSWARAPRRRCNSCTVAAAKVEQGIGATQTATEFSETSSSGQTEASDSLSKGNGRAMGGNGKTRDIREEAHNRGGETM